MSLKDVSKSITALLGERSDALDRSIWWAKILAAIGAVTIAFGKSLKADPALEIAGAAVVFVATTFVLWADKKSAKTLSQARQAIDEALAKEQEFEDERRKSAATDAAYAEELDRLSHMQAARDYVRAIFEQVTERPISISEITLIRLILEQTKRALFLAHGFKMSDYFTICVYQVEQRSGYRELVCKAQLRSIECDIQTARRWREGIGAAGICLAKGQEVVVPDLLAEALGSMYAIPEKKVDDDRYRAIVAEPIYANGEDQIWGVLVATSSVPNHFSVDGRRYVNVAQSLAGMISLAVKLMRSKAATPPKGALELSQKSTNLGQ